MVGATMAAVLLAAGCGADAPDPAEPARPVELSEPGYKAAAGRAVREIVATIATVTRGPAGEAPGRAGAAADRLNRLRRELDEITPPTAFAREHAGVLAALEVAGRGLELAAEGDLDRGLAMTSGSLAAIELQAESMNATPAG